MVLVPEWVARNQRQRAILSLVRERDEQKRYWTPLLQDKDHRLELALIGNCTDVPGIVPYRWHVLRHNEAGPDTYWAIEDEGRYREMGEDVLRFFARTDLWDPRVRDDVQTALRHKREGKERAKALKKEQRIHELTANVNATIRPSALFSDDVRWANRSAGRRGRKEN